MRKRSGIPHLTPTLSALEGGEGESETRLRTRTRIARRLRREATGVEKRLWWALREMAPSYRFRRQHPIGRYIVDFACPGCKLAIELDGGQHATRIEADAARTADIARRGYRVIRFWNIDVVENLAGVIEDILRELRAGGLAHLTPVLFAPEGGEEDEMAP